MVISCSVYAEEYWELSDEVEEPTIGYSTQLTKSIAMLVVLLLVIVAILWALKKLTRGKMLSLNNIQNIKVLERRPLSNKSALYLVEVDNIKFLVAESHFKTSTKITSLGHSAPT